MRLALLSAIVVVNTLVASYLGYRAGYTAGLDYTADLLWPSAMRLAARNSPEALRKFCGKISCVVCPDGSMFENSLPFKPLDVDAVCRGDQPGWTSVKER